MDDAADDSRLDVDDVAALRMVAFMLDDCRCVVGMSDWKRKCRTNKSVQWVLPCEAAVDTKPAVGSSGRPTGLRRRFFARKKFKSSSSCCRGDCGEDGASLGILFCFEAMLRVGILCQVFVVCNSDSKNYILISPSVTNLTTHGN